MNVLEYRMLSVDDRYNTKYRAWSRVYEYPKVLDDLDCLELPESTMIHNTSCGGEPVHMMFANALEDRFPLVLHSDILPKAPCENYVRYNLLKPWISEPFDVVICISTVEHLPKPRRVEALKHLCDQVKPGGHLFLTFDWPRVVNKEVEVFFQHKMTDVPVRLNGGNSVSPDRRYKHLNIIYLHAQKEKV